MQVKAVDFISVCVPGGRMEEAMAFYGGILGLRQEGIANEGWVEYQAGSLSIGLDSEPFLPPAGPPEGEVRIALAVDDVPAAVEELRTKGVDVVFGQKSFDPCDMAAIRDPFGNLIMLHRRRDGSAG